MGRRLEMAKDTVLVLLVIILIVTFILCFASLVEERTQVRGTVTATDCSTGWYTSPVVVLNTSEGPRGFSASRETCVAMSTIIGHEVIVSLRGTSDYIIDFYEV